MAAPAKAKVYRVAVSGGFHGVTKKGEAISMHQGDLVRGDHVAVKEWPHFFELADEFDRPDVEAATAAPGEKRGA